MVLRRTHIPLIRWHDLLHPLGPLKLALKYNLRLDFALNARLTLHTIRPDEFVHTLPEMASRS